MWLEVDDIDKLIVGKLRFEGELKEDNCYDVFSVQHIIKKAFKVTDRPDKVI